MGQHCLAICTHTTGEFTAWFDFKQWTPMFNFPSLYHCRKRTLELPHAGALIQVPIQLLRCFFKGFLGLETAFRVKQWPTVVLQLSVFEKGTPRCINFGVFLDTLMWWSMTINLWHLIIQISLVSVYQVSPIFNWRQPLRSITAMFPSHHLSNSLNHTTFPAQVAAVMLSCVPMHHGLAVCPVSNDHGTMMVGNRWWIGPICSQRIRVLYSFIWFCWQPFVCDVRTWWCTPWVFLFTQRLLFFFACCGWVDGVQWFRFGSESIISIVWECKKFWASYRLLIFYRHPQILYVL